MRISPVVALLLVPVTAGGGFPHARTHHCGAGPYGRPVQRRPSPSAVPTAPRETPRPPSAPPRAPENLTVTDADTVVTQQYREQVFVLRTTGPDCGLSGYPTVTLRDAAGKAFTVAYARGGFGLSTVPATPLTLSRTTSASFSVATSRVSPCADATTISIVLPGTSIPLTARTTAQLCQGRGGLSPVRRLDADG